MQRCLCKSSSRGQHTVSEGIRHWANVLQELLVLLSFPPLAGSVCSSALPLAAQKKQEAEEGAPQNGKAELPADFDTSADRHRGQLALRKLYHESERLLVVLYTSPTCGPCRSLKPIFSKVVDDYPGKVCSCFCPPKRANLQMRRACACSDVQVAVFWDCGQEHDLQWFL